MSTPHNATLIRNGRVITATDDYVADILMQNGIIHTIGQKIEVGEDVAVLDANGLYLLPGGVDTHVHLENVIGPTITCDTFASGTKAAAFGGTTTLVDFALQTEADSPLGAIARAQRSAEPQVAVDFSLHVIVTRVDDQVLKDVRHAMRHEGVTSFKMFMAYPGVMMADDASIFRMLRQVGADGGRVRQPCQRLAIAFQKAFQPPLPPVKIVQRLVEGSILGPDSNRRLISRTGLLDPVEILVAMAQHI